MRTCALSLSLARSLSWLRKCGTINFGTNKGAWLAVCLPCCLPAFPHFGHIINSGGKTRNKREKVAKVHQLKMPGLFYALIGLCNSFDISGSHPYHCTRTPSPHGNLWRLWSMDANSALNQLRFEHHLVEQNYELSN